MANGIAQSPSFHSQHPRWGNNKQRPRLSLISNSRWAKQSRRRRAPTMMTAVASHSTKSYKPPMIHRRRISSERDSRHVPIIFREIPAAKTSACTSKITTSYSASAVIIGFILSQQNTDLWYCSGRWRSDLALRMQSTCTIYGEEPGTAMIRYFRFLLVEISCKH